MNFYRLWFKRTLFSPQTVFHFSALFSLLGFILAAAALTAAVTAFSGFSLGLEKSIIDRHGHIRILAERPILKKDLLRDLSPYQDEISRRALFLSFEGLLLNKGRFKGVLLEAVEDQALQFFLKRRILEGGFSHKEPFLIAGSALAQELNLRSGLYAEALVSQSGDFYLSRRRLKFKVGAKADFGRHEYNSSLVFLPLSSAEAFGFDKAAGASLWLKDKRRLDQFEARLRGDLEESYSISSWKSGGGAFFEVIEADKKIIFFVLLILILSAAFNISSSLFAQAFRRIKDISILKAMGAKKSHIRNIFIINGLLLGFTGASLGIALGLAFCRGLIAAQNKWHFIPEEVYKVNEIVWGWNGSDLAFIFGAGILASVLSSLPPAQKAYKMSIKKGLSYQ